MRDFRSSRAAAAFLGLKASAYLAPAEAFRPMSQPMPQKKEPPQPRFHLPHQASPIQINRTPRGAVPGIDNATGAGSASENFSEGDADGFQFLGWASSNGNTPEEPPGPPGTPARRSVSMALPIQTPSGTPPSNLGGLQRMKTAAALAPAQKELERVKPSGVPSSVTDRLREAKLLYTEGLIGASDCKVADPPAFGSGAKGCCWQGWRFRSSAFFRCCPLAMATRSIPGAQFAQKSCTDPTVGSRRLTRLHIPNARAIAAAHPC